MRVDAIVVVNHRSHALLARNLVATTEGWDPATLTVVVVDNSQDAAEATRVAALAAARGWAVVSMPNRGFGAGVDAGVAHARAAGADAFLVLNPDLELGQDAARELLAAARHNHRALVAPTLLREDGEVWFAGGALDLATGRTRTRPDLVGEPRWLTGACLAAHDELWRAVGGFSDAYFMYWEDIDLSARVREAGGRLCVRADVVGVHAIGGTQQQAGTRRRSDLYYRHNCRGRMVFAARHLDRRAVRAWAWRSPGYARLVVLRGGKRQLLRSPGPLWAAVRGTCEGLWYARRDRRESTAP